jgi:hypothetical protein
MSVQSLRSPFIATFLIHPLKLSLVCKVPEAAESAEKEKKYQLKF